LLNRVEKFRRERDSGRVIHTWITAEEWQVILQYDEVHDSYRRQHEMNISQMFQVLMTLLARAHG